MTPRKDHGCSSFLTSDGDQVSTGDVQGEAFSCGAVRGKSKNPRGRAVWGGAWMKIRGPGRDSAKKRANLLTQKIDKST